MRACAVCVVCLALVVALAAAGPAVDATVVKNAAVLLDATVGMSSTITIGNTHGIAELKGALDPSATANDLVLDMSFSASGWLTVYHSMAPYLEHNGHIHFHASDCAFANIVKTESFAVLNFWATESDSINQTIGVLSVFFPSFFDYTATPFRPLPDNVALVDRWIAQHGSAWRLADDGALAHFASAPATVQRLRSAVPRSARLHPAEPGM